LKKATLFLYISFLSKAFAEIPTFPPLKKGGGGGIYEGHFKKLNSYKKTFFLFGYWLKVNGFF